VCDLAHLSLFGGGEPRMGGEVIGVTTPPAPSIRIFLAISEERRKYSHQHAPTLRATPLQAKAGQVATWVQGVGGMVRV
jgi:hypothetical protein